MESELTTTQQDQAGPAPEHFQNEAASEKTHTELSPEQESTETPSGQLSTEPDFGQKPEAVPEHSQAGTSVEGQEETGTAHQLPQTITTASPMQEWWEAASFAGKEHTSFASDGALSLNATKHSPVRKIAQLHADSADATIKALSEKFPEVVAKVTELREEWDKSEDKQKLLGKTARFYDYLQAAPAIGDYEPLFAQVLDWKNELERVEDDTYNAKKALVEKAERIAASTEWKDGNNKLREFADTWKSLGYVDKTRNDELWDRLEAARNTFNTRKREHNDDVEKDMLRNLDLKLELVDKAEALAASEEWKKSTELFKALMEEWKGVGRTLNDKNEALWQRFILAKNTFYDRKRLHFEEIQTEQEGNYAVKLALIERAEALSHSTDWNGTSNAYAAIMEEWKKSGRVQMDKADELWDRLCKAKDIFFNAKREHFEVWRVEQNDNLAQKMALVRRAEQLKNSTQWRDATDEFAELMEEWKKTGPVAKEQSEQIWQQFSAARRAFFDRKDADRERRKGQMVQQQTARLQQTREFLRTLQEELKDEEEKIEDFRQGMSNTGTGKKEDELRRHLEKLIAQGGPSIERKRKKMEEVAAQLAQLEAEDKRKHNDNRKPQNNTPQHTAPLTQPEAKIEPVDNTVADTTGSGELKADEQSSPEAKEEANHSITAAEPAHPLEERNHAAIDNMPVAETDPAEGNAAASEAETEAPAA